MMCGAAQLWAGRLQSTYALSIVEAEYMALVADAQECGFIKQLLLSLGVVLEMPLTCLRTIPVASHVPINP